jgi:hypothetical protein
MYPCIYKYFLLNKKLNLPGIGSFEIKTTSSFFDDNHILKPPTEQINFSTTTALADKTFYQFLAKELHIEEVDAIKNFHDFSYQLQNGINKSEGIILPGIGAVKKQASGNLTFEKESYIHNYLPELTINNNKSKTIAAEISAHQHIYKPPQTENPLFTEENNVITNPSKDYWWVFAIALSLIGIAAIMYKLF